MELISPLAKVLAEANGIDWHTIRGSGDGGAVVEQDILNYLSRVMSGEEEPPPGSVDEPPPGWTGEMPAMPSMDMLSAAGVESDITEFVSQQRGAPMQAAAPAVPAPSFPDLQVPVAAQVEPEPQDAPVEPDEALEADSLDFELDDDQPELADQEADALVASAPEFSSSVAEVQPEVVPAAAVHAEPEQPAAEVEMPPVAALAEAQPAAAPGFGLGGFLSRLYRRDADAAPEPTPAPAPTPAPVVPAVNPPQEVQPAAVVPEPVVPEVQAPAPAAVVEEPTPAPLPEPVQEPVHVAPAAAAQPVPAVVPVPLPAASAQAVTLRLNSDVGSLVAAQGQIAAALGQEVPLPLLVGRAAARSLGVLGLSRAALADHAGQPQAADLQGDFRASLADVTRAGGQAAELLVLDAGSLGLDELHLGGLSLSVGRVQDGQVALSLRGDVEPQVGARFLHEVAALLATPITLLF
ncbi:E3 binding domain-containing protein [Deinococcus sonorensis]|uniref:E3 binding domain-containing protein n=2 Tax=Deinococcus sonorensis TaxID=309891 RepID=A0AAU7UBI3_9DEIO